MRKNVIAVIDGAAGSCGKAKVCGELATDKQVKIGASVTNCMPNAGHTFVSEEGDNTVFRNIPVASVNPETELFIGPGSAIDMEVFEDEYARVEKFLGNRKIYVHEMVPLIEQRHIQYEKQHIKSGSTFKGCGAVSQEKIIRDKKLRFFKTFKNAIVCSNDEWLDRLYKHLDDPFEYVLLEGAQGCDLSLNHSGNYPYVTSRNVSTSQLLADTGISPERLLETIMVIRPFPIRISDVTKSGEVIYTGAYGKGERLYWTQINIASMYGNYPHSEYIDCFNSHLSIKYLKHIIGRCPEVYLKQIFGEDYRKTRLGEVSIIEALEVERLMYKSQGITEYETKIIDLPTFSSEFPPNTIIDQSEDTTVTKMERKVFDLDIKKLKNNCRINTPYGLYLNFIQHLDADLEGQKCKFEDYYFNRYQREYFNYLESETDSKILALGTGARNGDRIVKENFIKRI